jgi:Ca2+-binding EF-hand superfamily protein
MGDAAVPPPKRPKMMRRYSSGVVLARQRAGLIAKLDTAPAAPTKDTVQAEDMFRKLDPDGKGVLDHDQFRMLLQSIGQECNRLHPCYVEELLRQADRNRDGAVTLDAFKRVHSQLLAFDKLLLKAPRRQLAEPGVPPHATSKLRLQASLVCPPLATVTLPAEPTSADKNGGASEDGSDDDCESDEEPPPPPPPPFCVDAHFGELAKLGEGGYGL